MMKILASFKNASRMKERLDKIEAKARKNLINELYAVANKIRNTAIKKINQPGQGILYGKLRDVKKVNYNLPGAAQASRRTHRASAPGDPPAKDTGHLQSSINVTKNERMMIAQITVSADYGAPLEFGTVDMAARPFLRPSIEEHKDELPAGVRNAYTASIP